MNQFVRLDNYVKNRKSVKGKKDKTILNAYLQVEDCLVKIEGENLLVRTFSRPLIEYLLDNSARIHLFTYDLDEAKLDNIV